MGCVVDVIRGGGKQKISGKSSPQYTGIVFDVPKERRGMRRCSFNPHKMDIVLGQPNGLCRDRYQETHIVPMHIIETNYGRN